MEGTFKSERSKAETKLQFKKKKGTVILMKSSSGLDSHISSWNDY